MLKEDTFKDLLNYILVIILFILAFFIIKPIFFPIVYGLLAAYIIYPLYKFTLRKVKNESLSALIISLGLLIILLVFFSVVLGTIFNQLINLYHIFQKIDITSLAKSLTPLSEEISKPPNQTVERIECGAECNREGVHVQAHDPAPPRSGAVRKRLRMQSRIFSPPFSSVLFRPFKDGACEHEQKNCKTRENNRRATWHIPEC